MRISPSKKGGDVYSKRASDSEIAGGDLTTYEGTKGTDLVDKEVDERILGLLGLEEVFDIDYATYLSLLKERMVKLPEWQTLPFLLKRQNFLQMNSNLSRVR